MNVYKVTAAYEVEPHTWKSEDFIINAPTSYLARKMVKNDLDGKYAKSKILYVEKMVKLSKAAKSIFGMV